MTVENVVLNSLIKDVDNLHDQCDSREILNCRKPQKVRLLTDIIRREIWGAPTIIPSSDGIMNSERGNNDVIRTKATDESDDLQLDSISGSEEAVQEDAGKDTVDKKKHAKTLPVEDRGPLQMRCSKSAFGNVWIYKKDEENNCVGSSIACSKSASEPFSGVVLHSGFKRQPNENTDNGKVIQNRKKNKKPRFEDGQSSARPRQESLSRELQLMHRDVEIKRTGAGTLQLKMANGASTERGFHHFLKCNLAACECGKKSSFCINGSSILEECQDPLKPLQNSMQREDLILKSSAEPSQTRVAISPFSSILDTFSGIGRHAGAYRNKPTQKEASVSDMQTNVVFVEGESPQMYKDVNFRRTGFKTLPANAAEDRILESRRDTSLGFCMDTQRNGTESTFLNDKSEVHKEHRVRSKDAKIKPAEAASLSLASAKVVHCGLKSKKVTFRKAGMTMGRNYLSQVQGRASQIGPKDFPFICDYGNMDVQGHSVFNINQSGERTSEMCELDALDDVPMEIVELLAKNRLERRLLEAKNANRNKFCLLETTKDVKISDTVELTGVCEDEMSKNLQEKISQMQKSQTINAGGGIFATGTSVAAIPVGERSNYPSHLKKNCSSNINQMEESCDTNGIFAFPLSQGCSSSGNHVAGAGYSQNFDIRNCGWNWDKLGPCCPTTCLQCLKENPKGQLVSYPTQCGEPHNVCFPDMANGPFEIDCSQKFEGLSQRQCRYVDSEIFKKTNAEQPCACTQKKIGNCQKPVIPSDLYTNETMPAMQLLSLMDAGISSRTSFKVAENMEFAKQPSFPQSSHCKAESPWNGGIFKVRDACKQSFPACFGQNHDIAKSLEHFPSGPISDAVALSVQRDNNCTRVSGIMGQISESQTVKSRKKAKMKNSSSSIQPKDYQFYGSASGSGSLGKNRESFPINGLQKGFHSAPSSMVFPSKSHLIEDSIINVEVNKKDETFRPVKGSCMTEICSVNRNPADFSIPELGNEFMIEARVVYSNRCKSSISVPKRFSPSALG
ncbi:hypothetical protein F0562_022929 [Nyssa sinensis]|uniref:Uncharacterized protein n=1 Tax=Nyssa sinensis TaxID=561372 RepID=A0A5J5BIZ2_9ASTE|nr:hypothetical protein F0562_022929 [Nyssa sinensis]